MTRAISCCLIPIDDSLSTINIPDSQELIVGRCRETNIKERSCSRRQLSVVADYGKCELSIKCLGSNPAAINGKLTAPNILYTVNCGSIIELVTGLLKYTVQFSYGNSNKTQKRLREEDTEQTDLKIKKMVVSSENNIKWQELNSRSIIIFTTPDFSYKSKVASFDLDGTLIKTKSGYTFPKNQSDWMLWDPKVKPCLTKLKNEGYMLIMFTNQAGLSPPAGQEKIPGFKSKIEAIVEELGVPMKVYISTSYGIYRKPAPGMWDLLMEQSTVPVRKEESFYVGDAAGRENNWKFGKKKDFAMSDRLFALNLNLLFYTPEEYFLKERKVPYAEIPFIPSRIPATVEPDYCIPSAKQEVILMVGSPGSGKSCFVLNRLLPCGYAHVSRDNLGTWQKCVKELERGLALGRSVVVDNTNPDPGSRGRFVEACRRCQVPVRCFVMECPLERALHNTAFRLMVDKTHEVVAPPLVRRFYSSFEPPQLDEGFSQILYVPFLPSFKSKKDEELYNCHLDKH